MIIVIGLDGATWNLLKAFAKKGHLPTIAKLMHNGVYGNLESSIPPVTFPAWKCYSTGKNPGKFGVYWWMNVDVNNKKYISNNSTSFKSDEIWDYLGNIGINCCVTGMPTTYPPKKIKGCMVSELPINELNYTYPSELGQKLKDKFNYKCTESDYHGADKHDAASERLEMIKQRFVATQYLIDEYNPDFINLTIFHIDNIQHFYWKYMENDDPEFGNIILDAWKLIDTEINTLINKLGKDTNIIFMSDHGFTPLKAIFDLDNWLIEKKYLVMKKQKFGMNNIINAVHKLGLYKYAAYVVNKSNTIPLINKIIPSAENIIESELENSIDWEKSKVITLSQGVIYINKHVVKTSEYENFRNELITEISSIKNPTTGEKLANCVYKKEDIYSGKYLSQAPDLVILPNEGYELYHRRNIDKIWDFSPEEDGWSGIHKLQGIFLAHGPDIKQNATIDGARIIDLAPTILHMFGVPIPRDMDGRVLTEIFREDSEMAQREVVNEKINSELKSIKNKISMLKKVRNV